MKRFLEPYRDPSGLGFALATELRRLEPALVPRPVCRQRCIVAVCWNFTEDQALFINGAGLAVPEWHDRETLAQLLRRCTVRQEFSRVIGDGQFAFKPAYLKALENSGKIKAWLVHHFQEPDRYLDDANAWATYIEADQAAERKELIRYGCHPESPAERDAALNQELEQRRAELEVWRRDELAKGVQIGAWLRGALGDPPLLALMKGAA